MFILAYFVVGMLAMYVDAFTCFACNKKYNILGSLWCALIWPISVPIAILSVWAGR